MTKVELCQIIGNNIRTERIRRNMTIEDLAELLCVSNGYVGLVEHGRRGTTARTLFDLSNIFSIPINDLFKVESQTMKESDDLRRPRIDKIIGLLDGMSGAELDCMANLIKSQRDFKCHLLSSSIEQLNLRINEIS